MTKMYQLESLFFKSLQWLGGGGGGKILGVASWEESAEMWMIWCFGPETKSGKFLVKSLYLALEAGCPSLFPSSCIWNVWVQPKISFFAWEATWGKALTPDLIQKRGWALANRCFMCLEKEETIDHLLLHCTKTRVLWDLLFNLFGLSWMLPSSVRDSP